MTPVLPWLLALLPTQFTAEPQRVAGIEGTLTTTVPERIDRGPPRVRLDLRVVGPATMQVEPAHLGDEVRAWKVLRASSWTATNDGLVVGQSFHLEQTRSGPVALPGVRVAVRAGPGEPTREFDWPEPLGGPPVEPGTGVEFPPSPPGRWPLALALSATMIGGFLALLVWRLTRRPPVPHVPTPEEVADAALVELTHPDAWADARWAATRLSAVVRTYLTARTGLDLHSRTVRECLDLLRTAGVLDPAVLPALEALLTWCDATRFAGPQADASGGPAHAEQARTLLANLLRPVEPEARP